MGWILFNVQSNVNVTICLFFFIEGQRSTLKVPARVSDVF